MPRVSQFFGVVVSMYFNDHLPSHFHAEYGEFEAVYSIETLELLRGQIPQRTHNMVVEWALLHRAELRTNWERTHNRCRCERLSPWTSFRKGKRNEAWATRRRPFGETA